MVYSLIVYNFTAISLKSASRLFFNDLISKVPTENVLGMMKRHILLSVLFLQQIRNEHSLNHPNYFVTTLQEKKHIKNRRYRRQSETLGIRILIFIYNEFSKY